MNERWRKPVGLLLLAVLSLGVAACGDDDDDDVAASGDTTEEETDTTAAEGDDAEGEEGEGEGPPDVNPCAEGVSPEEAGLPPAEEPAEGAAEVTVTATEYEFAGVDALEAGGEFAITFANDGAELHELVLQRIPESETRTVEEMMQSEEEPETEDVAFGFACPGTETVVNADITEPGRYVALCFIPVGTTPETDPATFSDDGEPHAARGMVAEFNVG